MSDLEPDWDFTAVSEDGAVISHSGPSEPNPLLQNSCSFTCGASEADEFPDIFKALTDVQLHTAPTAPTSTVTRSKFSRVSDEGELSRGKRKAEEIEFRKCVSESDKASMLDEAIEYLKTLKLQVQMMSMSGGALCQAPYMPPTGIHSIQIPHFSPFVPIRPGLGMGMGFGMGMVNMYCPTGFPMISVPSASLHLPQSAATQLPLMFGSGVLPHSQVQVPFIPSQPLVETAAASNAQPTFVMEFSPIFNISNQGESSSHNTHRIAKDFKLVPNINQQSASTGSHSTVHATHIIPPPMGGNVVAEAPHFDEEAGTADSSQCRKRGESSNIGGSVSKT
ncbi:hypothetical protein L1049_006578 [Liquidambar formosana]|uniref:Uncharacterized protein n=1 Tax=Liquidambar formosana TaxID=63359 RepID=A0AAP0RFP1_LIQFO